MSDTKDPFAEREAENYESPVPSREYILQVLNETGHPLSREELQDHFGLHSEQEHEGMRRRLRAMERDGQLIRTRKNAYGLIKKMDLIRGRVLGHSDGFGFLVRDDGGEDLFISARRMKGLLHGDRVVVRVVGIDHRGRSEAAPVEILERAHDSIVGRFRLEHGISYVIPSNKRISQDVLVPPDKRGGALDNQIVVARLVEQPTWQSQPIGEITEVLGEHMAPGLEIDIAIRAHDIPNEWTSAVKAETTQIDHTISESEIAQRVDLRNVPLVTIDGEDSKDFDDAVYCEPKGKGWRLLVAIADVSHYVLPDTALDSEAEKRGNSVYFPGRVVPMLPEVLSNNLCSLNPQVDRLCMVCELNIDTNGKTRDYTFFKGVMRSAARLTYTEVARIVQEKEMKTRRSYGNIVTHLDDLYELYKALQKARNKRGTIEFESVETRIVFGEKKKIERIIPIVRNDAHRIIEECMIAANVASANFLLEHKLASLYRVHQGPGEEKLEKLKNFLQGFGLKLGGKDSPEPKHYAKLLEEIKDRDDAHVIQTVMLRSLSQAVYNPENTGHFGLAFDAYTHFTSPIRRYPDLLVHRGIKHLIEGTTKKDFHYKKQQMEQLGEHCSMTERRADDATRDVTDWLKCEYLQDKVGEQYTGHVTAVTSFGLFVELDQLFVEGLVHVTSLDNDYYHFDPTKHLLSGERTGRVFRLGDAVEVKVARVTLDEKKIDFDLVQEPVKYNSKKSKKTKRLAKRPPKNKRR